MKKIKGSRIKSLRNSILLGSKHAIFGVILGALMCFAYPAFAQNKLPSQPQGVSGGSFVAAPVPDRSQIYDEGNTAGRSGLQPGLFHRYSEFTGSGYSNGSSDRDRIDQRVRPGAGVKFFMPLQPNWLGK